MIHLRGRTALITGATQGVGRSIALAMAEAGAAVVIHGRDAIRDRAAAEELLQHCSQRNTSAQVVFGDLVGDSTISAVSQLFQAAVALAPQIDILVNNAGTFIDKPFLEMDWPTWDQTLRLNVAAPYFLTQQFARRWVANKTAGRVLMVGSINGRLAEPTHSCYDTSKGAVEAMVKSLCVSLAPLGIRVNGMAPGLVRTPLTGVIDQDDRFRRWMELHTPNGEVPGSEVCGGAAVFLCSDQARHIHGQMLLVDGGMSAWQQPDMPENWS